MKEYTDVGVGSGKDWQWSTDRLSGFCASAHPRTRMVLGSEKSTIIMSYLLGNIIGSMRLFMEACYVTVFRSMTYLLTIRCAAQIRLQSN